MGDFDHDGIPNDLDLDSDGDGLTDLEETQVDTDHDGMDNFVRAPASARVSAAPALLF